MRGNGHTTPTSFLEGVFVEMRREGAAGVQGGERPDQRLLEWHNHQKQKSKAGRSKLKG